MADADFDRWLAKQGPPEPPEPIQARCCVCRRRFEIDYCESQEEADEMEHWCNSGPRCCP